MSYIQYTLLIKCVEFGDIFQNCATELSNMWTYIKRL